MLPRLHAHAARSAATTASACVSVGKGGVTVGVCGEVSYRVVDRCGSNVTKGGMVMQKLRTLKLFLSFLKTLVALMLVVTPTGGTVSPAALQ
jgi:hypothetical protein